MIPLKVTIESRHADYPVSVTVEGTTAEMSDIISEPVRLATVYGLPRLLDWLNDEEVNPEFRKILESITQQFSPFKIEEAKQ
jgi:hypothetical protein